MLVRNKLLKNIAIVLCCVGGNAFAGQEVFDQTQQRMISGGHKVGDIVGSASVDVKVFDEWYGSWTIRGEYHLGIYAGNQQFEEKVGSGIVAHQPRSYSSATSGFVTEPAIIEVWRQRKNTVQGNDLVRIATLGEFAGAQKNGRYYADWVGTWGRDDRFRGAKYYIDRHLNDPIFCRNSSSIANDFGVYRSGHGIEPYYGCQDSFDSEYTKNVIMPAMSQKGLGNLGPGYTESWTRYPTGMHWTQKIVGWDGVPSGGSWPIYAKDKLVLRPGKFRSDTFVIWAYGVGAGEKIYASSSYSSWYDYYDRPSVIFKDKLNWR